MDDEARPLSPEGGGRAGGRVPKPADGRRSPTGRLPSRANSAPGPLAGHDRPRAPSAASSTAAVMTEIRRLARDESASEGVPDVLTSSVDPPPAAAAAASTSSAARDDTLAANTNRQTGSFVAESALRAEVRAFMAAQLRYAKHGVTSTSTGVQCDRLMNESRIIDGFCRVAVHLCPALDQFEDLTDWAQNAANISDLMRAKATTPGRLMADFCVAMTQFLQMRGGVVNSDLRGEGDETDPLELGDGLRESERARRKSAAATASTLFTSTRQQVVRQAERIAKLEDELRKTRARHLHEVAHMESKHRETVRYEVSKAVASAKAAMRFGNDDEKALRFENASLVNKVTMRDTEIKSLQEKIVTLEQMHEARDLEIANLEVALMKVEVGKEHQKEDLMRDSINAQAKGDQELASLNARVNNFAQTVMAYAAQIRTMELEHTAQLRSQGSAYEKSLADMTKTLEAASERLAARDKELEELRREYAKLGLKRASRHHHVARSSAAFASLTVSEMSRQGARPPNADDPPSSSSSSSSSSAASSSDVDEPESAATLEASPPPPRPEAQQSASAARLGRHVSLTAGGARQASMSSRKALTIAAVGEMRKSALTVSAPRGNPRSAAGSRGRGGVPSKRVEGSGDVNSGSNASHPADASRSVRFDFPSSA